eukprot:6471326-Alexandrium_andersonii.AAC.1
MFGSNAGSSAAPAVAPHPFSAVTSPQSSPFTSAATAPDAPMPAVARASGAQSTTSTDQCLQNCIQQLST